MCAVLCNFKIFSLSLHCVLFLPLLPPPTAAAVAAAAAAAAAAAGVCCDCCRGGTGVPDLITGQYSGDATVATVLIDVDAHFPGFGSLRLPKILFLGPRWFQPGLEPHKWAFDPGPNILIEILCSETSEIKR